MKNFCRLFFVALVCSVLNILASSCRCDKRAYISRPWKVQEGHIGFTNYDSLWSMPASVAFNEQTHGVEIFARKAITEKTCQYLGVVWRHSKPNGPAEFSFSERHDINAGNFSEKNEINSAHCTKQPGTFKITEIDSVNRTISGRFSGTLCSLNNSNVVQMSIYDGQFLKVPF